MQGLIIGKSGQLARALSTLSGRNTESGDTINLTCLDRQALDLTASAGEMLKALNACEKPDFVIIAAAYTAVDKAEEDQDTAELANGRAPGIIGEYCVQKGIPVVHISTDYVFPGDANHPYTPDMPTGPTNVYGKTKLNGEVSLRQSGAQHCILRTSWVYDGTGKNFLTTMLRFGKDRNEMRVVGDQIGRPTFATDLAEASLTAALNMAANKDKLSGTYHVSNSGEPISWADFAGAIFDEFETDLGHKVNVTAIPSVEYPTPATRPAYSVMDVSSFEETFDFPLPHWGESLKRAGADYRAAQPET